jgi:hypothetical protein
MNTFNSKNGPMEANKENLSYMIETLFYEVSKELENQLRIRDSQYRFHLLRNLLAHDIRNDMYIVALMLSMATSDDKDVYVPVRFGKYEFVAEDETSEKLVAELDKLFQTANNDVFSRYVSISDNTIKTPYNEMSGVHKIKALTTRLRNLNVHYRDIKMLYELYYVFNVDWFVSCNKTIDGLVTQLYNVLGEE